MKILIVAPLKRKITSRISASRSKIIFNLVSGLIKKKHNVSILGTGNSIVSGAKIIPVIPKAFQELGPFENPFYAHTSFLSKQAKMLEKIGNHFDVIHNHCYPEFFPLLTAKAINTPILTTIHSQLTEELDEALSLFKNIYFVAISKAAKKLAKKTKIYKVIYNGINTNIYKFSPNKSNYLFWRGRLSKAKDKNGNFLDPKGVRWAIKLAQASKSKLFFSGNVEDIDFFQKDIKPQLSESIKWIGPISPKQLLTQKQMVKLMQEAKAFLMTVNWYEPFGLIMAEAQSCGTPVIGFGRGAVPELVNNGKTGFVVPPKKGINGLKAALKKINEIEPKDCRKWVEGNFSLKKMVDNYEKAYIEIINKNGKKNS